MCNCRFIPIIVPVNKLVCLSNAPVKWGVSLFVVTCREK